MTNEMQDFKSAYFAQTGRMAREAMAAKAQNRHLPAQAPDWLQTRFH